jgi:hypothetical protein
MSVWVEHCIPVVVVLELLLAVVVLFAATIKRYRRHWPTVLLFLMIAVALVGQAVNIHVIWARARELDGRNMTNHPW